MSFNALACVVSAPTLTDRVRLRLQELGRAKKFKQKDVADAMGFKSPSAVTKVLTGDSRSITLKFVEVCAREAGIPLAELVSDPGSTVRELNPTEAKLLRALRQWPESVTDALSVFVGFFADEPPAAAQLRNIHEHARSLNLHDRGVLEAFARLLRERIVTPEAQALLLERLTAGVAAASRRPGAKRDQTP